MLPKRLLLQVYFSRRRKDTGRPERVVRAAAGRTIVEHSEVAGRVRVQVVADLQVLRMPWRGQWRNPSQNVRFMRNVRFAAKPKAKGRDWLFVETCFQKKKYLTAVWSFVLVFMPRLAFLTGDHCGWGDELSKKPFQQCMRSAVVRILEQLSSRLFVTQSPRGIRV